MGKSLKVKIKMACKGCGVQTLISLTKDPNTKETTAIPFCNRCRNMIRRNQEMGAKKRTVTQDLGPVDIKKEVEALIWGETHAPKLVDRLRQKRFNNPNAKVS